MRPVTLWRSLAIVATLGWAVTALGWVYTAGRHDSSSSRPHFAERPRDQSERGGNRAHPVRARQPRTGPLRGLPASEVVQPDLSELRQQVRDEVFEEFERERAERRQERSERHLGRILDRVVDFAEMHDLDDDTQAVLESSMITMHERLEALRPAGPPEPGGPPPEVRESIEEAFDQMRDETAAVLGPEVAEAFAEEMTPRPLRDRG